MSNIPPECRLIARDYNAAVQQWISRKNQFPSMDRSDIEHRANDLLRQIYDRHCLIPPWPLSDDYFDPTGSRVFEFGFGRV